MTEKEANRVAGLLQLKQAAKEARENAKSARYKLRETTTMCTLEIKQGRDSVKEIDMKPSGVIEVLDFIIDMAERVIEKCDHKIEIL